MRGINLDINNEVTSIKFADTPSVDAFSRARVSQITTQLDLKHLHDLQPILVDNVEGGNGTSTYNSGTSSVDMEVSDDLDYVIRQTYQRFHYQSGKSQLLFFTFSGFQTQESVTKRVGYFSSSTTAPYTASLDGLFLESIETEISINVYRAGTEVESTAQASWNIDTMDGNGDSGITIDWSKDQILVIDFQFLGVGRVRWGLDVDGVIYYFHQSTHANSLTDVYIQSPNQPVRYEIRQSGLNAGSMKMICASVNSEGAINTIGKDGGIDDNGTHLDANSTSDWYYAIGLRLGSNRVDTLVDIINGQLLSTTADNFLFRILLNPTYSGTVTYNNISGYSCEYGLGATANTISANGYILYAGNGAQQLSEAFNISGAIRLGSSVAGVSDEIVIAVKPLGANMDIHRSINWREL